MLELKEENITVSKIVENFKNGSWSFPEFHEESEWEWQKNKAAQFISSLYRGCPVPVILLWETVAEVSKFTYFSIPRYAACVLDGKQRITTLCKITGKEGDIRVVFNPRGNDTKTGLEGQFRIESAVTKKSKDWIQVNKILGDRDDFCAVLDEVKFKEHRDRFIRLREILNYEMRIAKMVGHNLAEARVAFEAWKMVQSFRKH